MKKLMNKKTIFIACVILILALVVIIVVLNKDEQPNLPTPPTPTAVTIQDAEHINVKFTQYNNGDFSMKIPESWMVETVPGNNYAIRVYNPNNDMYQIFSIYSLGGFLKNKEAKQYYQVYSSISSTGFEKLPVLNPGTPENLYKMWTTIVGYVKTNMSGFANFNFPFFFNFKVREQFELNTKLKEDMREKVAQSVMRASFTDDKSKKNGEGLFSVSIIDLNSNDTNLPYAVYNSIGITAPESEFVNWESILEECLKSIKFSDKYINSIKESLNLEEDTAIDINGEIAAAAEYYTKAWQKRQTSVDVQIQKAADNALNMERVYDINTNKVYRVNKGWYANYIGDTYKLITEDMYKLPLTGIIK